MYISKRYNLLIHRYCRERCSFINCQQRLKFPLLFMQYRNQCLGSESGSVGSARFWLPEAEFKEFEQRLKFKPRLKYGWFHLKLY